MNEDWSDITPIPQNDAPGGVVCIDYDPDFRSAMDIFRAVVANGEFSLRALELTSYLLHVNAGNYSVWQYRRECLRALELPYEDEFEFVDEFAEDNPKNYQIWYHRRAIVESSGKFGMEKMFTQTVLEIDAKNYHAWAHRQWAIKTFSLWEDELEFTEQLLSMDLRNNSAWNQRWFVIHNSSSGNVSDPTIISEILFAFERIRQVQLNESAWNYLRGIWRKYPHHGREILMRCESYLVPQKNVEEESEPPFLNPFAHSLSASILENDPSNHSNIVKASKLYEVLTDLDPIREKYWNKKYQQLSIMIEST